MRKLKSDILHVQGIDVGFYTEDYRNEYISLTDIARFRNHIWAIKYPPTFYQSSIGFLTSMIQHRTG